MKKYSRVYVELTNICNRSCSFCPGTEREARIMSESELVSVLAKLRGVTDYLYFHLMGEPLTNPALFDSIRLANERGFKCAVTTNGTLLSSRGEGLIAAAPYKVNISLHSFEGESEEERRRYVEACCKFARESSAKGILTVLRLWNRGVEGDPGADCAKIVFEYFSDLSPVHGSRGARLCDKLHIEYGDRFEWPDMEARDFGERVFCHGLSDHFGILSDGRVVPCCLDRNGDMTLGNIFTEQIEDILTSERAVAIAEGFRNKEAREKLCRRCAYARRFKL